MEYCNAIVNCRLLLLEVGQTQADARYEYCNASHNYSLKNNDILELESKLLIIIYVLLCYSVQVQAKLCFKWREIFDAQRLFCLPVCFCSLLIIGLVYTLQGKFEAKKV